MGHFNGVILSYAERDMRLQHPAGLAAEEQAAQFLMMQGCRIVVRNWHCKSGEIDLVVWDGEVCVFVEVRMRSSEQFGGASASITTSKQRKLLLSAQTYLQSEHSSEPECRFDAVLINGEGHIEWLKNIIGM